MNITQFGHAAFTCKDLQESIHFYRDILGLTFKFTITYGDWVDDMKKESQESGKPLDEEFVKELESKRDTVWIAYFEIGEGAFVELFDAGSATEYAVPDGKHFNFNHMALMVEDIFATEKMLREAGVEIDTPAKLGMDQTYQMWSHDPDGNKIEFMQYTEKSWQLVGRE